MKKHFEIEDHWIRAYFRYGQPSFHFDMKMVDIPFYGVEFFGDSISSIVHSIFFARLAKFMEPFDSMKVHAGPSEGVDVWTARQVVKCLMTMGFPSEFKVIESSSVIYH